MPKQISWTYNVEVVGGAKISESKTISTEAVDEIGLNIDAQQKDKEIDIQPGGAGQVKFLLIRSDRYGDQVTYKVNQQTTARTLDGPHLLIGKGAAELLASATTAPNKLFITNGLPNDPITVSILVGRDATPP